MCSQKQFNTSLHIPCLVLMKRLLRHRRPDHCNWSYLAYCTCAGNDGDGRKIESVRCSKPPLGKGGGGGAEDVPGYQARGARQDQTQDPTCSITQNTAWHSVESSLVHVERCQLMLSVANVFPVHAWPRCAHVQSIKGDHIYSQSGL